jgi:hypothetical protein
MSALGQKATSTSDWTKSASSQRTDINDAGQWPLWPAAELTRAFSNACPVRAADQKTELPAFLLPLHRRNLYVRGLFPSQGIEEEYEMLNDDLNRNDLNRENLTGVDDRRTGMGGGMIGLIAAAAVLAVLFMWAPWSGPKVADNTAPGTTVGSSTTRPATPVAPTAPAREPAIPAAPSTTR